MIYINDIEQWMREKGIVALNIHQRDGTFQVQIREGHDRGFTCAQQKHHTLSNALREHSEGRAPKPTVMELLV